MAETYGLINLAYNMSFDYLREDFIHNYLFRISQVYEEGGNYGIQYGINCKYGIELEFIACDNDANHTRYSIGNRVNNCIVNQNSDSFFKYQFDMNSQETIRNQQIAQNANPLPRRIQPTIRDTFNEWTNFLLEVSNHYHSHTHNGTPTALTSRRGQSGFKIEYDPGVHFNTHNPNIRTICDSVAKLPGIDYRVTRFPNGGGIYTHNVNEIEQVLTTRGTPIADCLELVSPILVNEPFDLNGRIYPLGFLMLDNIINHLTAHSNVIFTHNDAFHVHLSKNQKTPHALLGDGPGLSQNEIVGFAKLFWLFEPLLFAGQPLYKSTNDCNGYQSLQSLFTYDEIRGGMTPGEIYNRLCRQDSRDAATGVVTPGIGRNRRSAPHAYRYCSLNIMNTLAGGIGTIEIRLGHTTMNNQQLQTHIQVYQLLFQLNLYFLKRMGDGLVEVHNNLITNLRDSCIPYYCRQTSEQYNLEPPDLTMGISVPPDVTNPGRPIKGFFVSCGDNTAYRTHLITNLLALFTQLTGAIPLMTTYKDIINLWHSNAPPIAGDDKTLDSANYPVYFSNTLNQIVIDLLSLNNTAYRNLPYVATAPDVYTVTGNRRTPPGDISIIPEIVGRMFMNYLPNPANPVASLDHPSKSCSVNNANQFQIQYNNGNEPIVTNTVRTAIADNRSQTHVFSEAIGAESQKTQTELLNYKISNGYFPGGKKSKKNKKIDKRRTKKRYKMKYSGGGIFDEKKTTTPKTSSTPVIKYKQPVINLNKGKDGYKIKKDNSKLVLYRTSNFSEINAIDALISKIVNELLQQHIITEEELMLMNSNNYIEVDLYVNDKVHNQLLSELSGIKGLKMDDAKLQNIKNVYKNIYKLP